MTDYDGNRFLTNGVVNAIWQEKRGQEFTAGHLADT